MGAVGEAGGAAEVQFARCVEDDAVADDDGVDVGVTCEIREDSGGDLDGDRVLGDRAGLIGCVGVDHCDELRSTRSWPCPHGRGVVGVGGAVECVVEQQSCDHLGVEVVLLLDRVSGTFCWRASLNNAWTVASIRAAMRTPVSGSNLADRFHMPSTSTHDLARALRRWRSRRSTPSPSCELLGFEIQAAGVLCGGSGLRDVGEPVGSADQLVALGAVEPPRCPGDRIDVLGRDRAIVECVGEIRGLGQGVRTISGLGRLARAIAWRRRRSSSRRRSRPTATNAPGRPAGSRATPALHGSRPAPT